jgi:hypothetical protein
LYIRDFLFLDVGAISFKPLRSLFCEKPRFSFFGDLRFLFSHDRIFLFPEKAVFVHTSSGNGIRPDGMPLCFAQNHRLPATVDEGEDSPERKPTLTGIRE